MDKRDAIKLINTYLDKVKSNHISFVDAWLFGSYAKGNYNNDSDIDLALILHDNLIGFETDVRLMSLRTGDETIIEVHTFTPNEFARKTPIVEQIKKYGRRISTAH